MKLLKENRGHKLFDIGLNNIFLHMSSQARTLKEKINKWDYIKLKSFCTAKETINKTKRPPTDWGNVFTNTWIPLTRG